MPWKGGPLLFASSLLRWMLPPAVAIICLMIFVNCSVWLLKQVLVAFGIPISSANHVRSQQADEERPCVDHNKALESGILHSLPKSKFEGANKEDGLRGMRDTECVICLGEFEAGEWLRHIPSCSHTFHMSCIDTWFQSHSTCPICRSDVCGPNEPQEP